MSRKRQPNPGLYVGTSGWAYSSWKPEFYPKEVKSKDFLSYYAGQMNATEVNYTFRRSLTEKVQEQWIAVTPPDFRFVLKANQYMTHIRRLKDCQDSVERFFSSIQPLVESRRLGPILFQLPPNLKADITLLREFLSNVPPGAYTAWEFRHQSWFTDDSYKALSDYDAALCFAENEDMKTPLVSTASFAYYRFRQPNYTEQRLRDISGELKRLSAEREVYAFFKHEEDPKSATWAATAFKLARSQGS